MYSFSALFIAGQAHHIPTPLVPPNVQPNFYSKFPELWGLEKYLYPSPKGNGIYSTGQCLQVGYISPFSPKVIADNCTYLFENNPRLVGVQISVHRCPAGMIVGLAAPSYCSTTIVALRFNIVLHCTLIVYLFKSVLLLILL